MHTDPLGSVVMVTDASRNVVERTQYAPYGQVLNRPEHDGPGYTGHEEDAATGLTNMQARYDNKAIGRMLSMDPVDVDAGTGANFNRYAYASDNPYRFTDPSGMMSSAPGPASACSPGPYCGHPDRGALVTVSGPVVDVGLHDPQSEESGGGVTSGPLGSHSSHSQSDSQSNGSSGSDEVVGGDRSDTADGGTAIPVAYQGYYHDQLVRELASGMKSEGANVLTEVNMCLGTICARIDILGRSPAGDLFGLEVKTGCRSCFTPQQHAVYPHLRAGNILVSPDRKILQIGLVPGVPLPSIPTILLYQRDASSPPFTVPLP